jgi:hypothetical protein
LAVLRLTTSASLVACWTGRFAGFSPLRGDTPWACNLTELRTGGGGPREGEPVDSA